ncbi:MAG: AtpZ/AtpI family protein [Acidobacteriota bacterium]|nr:AtpZ/AtpI family protein [Acidobacteriota bacterium]
MDPDNNAGKYLNLALVLPISAGVGFLLGYGLDKLFHTHWIQYVFLVLGIAAGFLETFQVLTGDQKK